LLPNGLEFWDKKDPGSESIMGFPGWIHLLGPFANFFHYFLPVLEFATKNGICIKNSQIISKSKIAKLLHVTESPDEEVKYTSKLSKV
jgi:hypothetical protein